jgi:phosphoglycerate dehydrogenase-like enzyme
LVTHHKLAVIDDYQGVARSYADWSSLPDTVGVTFLSTPLTDPEQLVATLRDFDIVVAMRERTPFPARVLRALPNLRLLVTTGSGNAAIDLATADELGVTVCGTRDSGVTSAVELTWGLILAVARHIPAEDLHVRAGAWQQSIGLDLKGRRLGVVGLGGAGSAVAAVGHAFGMDVVAWSAHLDPHRAASLRVTAVPKPELFATSDVVTVHLKLADSTRRTVGAAELAAMPSHAILVNTSRGPIVDEDALLLALHAGDIGGAGLDVYDTEPLPVGSPWHSAPRTVLTPHLGYVSRGTYAIFFADAVEDVTSWLDGSPKRRIHP